MQCHLLRARQQVLSQARQQVLVRHGRDLCRNNGKCSRSGLCAAMRVVKNAVIFMCMYARALQLPKKSFLLFGPRGTGKSTWLKQQCKPALVFDLLRNDVYFELLRRPESLREKVLAVDPAYWIVIDEVQRAPSLLNEVHALIEDHGYRFALTGSSARKLKRGQANLLAGRALVLNLFPLVESEYGNDLEIEDALRFGTLPVVVAQSESRIATLEAYAGTYLREEIKEEALTRNVDAFGRFLEIAALANAQVTNLSGLARDSGVARATVTTFFEILQDTLIVRRLDAWVPRLRVKETSHPKYYFFDCGVLRAIQGRLREPIGSEERGHLLETMVHQELSAAMAYQDLGGKLSYWRTADGAEIDFVWQRGERIVAIEVKASQRWRPEFDRGFEVLAESKSTTNFGVYLGKETLKKPWGVLMPAKDFFKALAEGRILAN
jgi:uncharacterized protein